MTGLTLRSRLEAGDKVFAGWMTTGSARLVDAVASVGFDAILFDVQHGEASHAETREAIARALLVGKPAGVRVGLGAYGEAARFLDLGAEVAIMPMIGSVEDAQRLVDTLKYPPRGQRSWGPTRAIQLLGMTVDTYRAGANDSTLALAMIETVPAVEALEAILDVPGLDGVFVGPSDLSISMSGGKALDHRLPEAVAVMERLIAGAKRRGKVTAIFCNGGEAAARNAAMGFDLMAVGSDMGFVLDGARAALAAARGSAEEGAPRY
jgi:4-hydroxy-2-oxoheptanedioate aldolase